MTAAFGPVIGPSIFPAKPPFQDQPGVTVPVLTQFSTLPETVPAKPPINSALEPSTGFTSPVE